MRVFIVILIVMSLLKAPTLYATERFEGFGLGVKAGVLLGCLSGAGVNVAYGLSKYLVFDTSFTQTYQSRSTIAKAENIDLNGYEEKNYKIHDASVRRSMLHSQFRLFPFSSARTFNLAIGAAAAKLTAHLKVEEISSGKIIDETLRYDQVLRSFSLGNQWTFRKTYMAIDWIGTMGVARVKRTKTTENEEHSSDGLNAIATNFEESFDKGCGLLGGTILLAFSFGGRV